MCGSDALTPYESGRAYVAGPNIVFGLCLRPCVDAHPGAYSAKKAAVKNARAGGRPKRGGAEDTSDSRARVL
jgi:hypothetical protein